MQTTGVVEVIADKFLREYRMGDRKDVVNLGQEMLATLEGMPDITANWIRPTDYRQSFQIHVLEGDPEIVAAAVSKVEEVERVHIDVAETMRKRR